MRSPLLKPSTRQLWSLSLAASALLLAGELCILLGRLLDLKIDATAIAASNSNDIDLVFTYPTKMSAKALCTRLVERYSSTQKPEVLVSTLCNFGFGGCSRGSGYLHHRQRTSIVFCFCVRTEGAYKAVVCILSYLLGSYIDLRV